MRRIDCWCKLMLMRYLVLCILLLSGCGSLPVQRTTTLEIVTIKTSVANCYLLRGEKNVLIDTSTAGHEEEITEKLKEAGVLPERLALIIITHAHADHAGAAPAFQKKYKIPVAGGKADLPIFLAGRNPQLKPTGIMGSMVRPFVDYRYAPFTPDILVEKEMDLGEYGIKGKIVPVGGHTPGSLVVTLEGGEVFAGDLLRGSILFSTTPTEHFFQDDLPVVHAAIKRLLDGGATVFYPGHFGPLEAGRVRKYFE